MRARLHRRASVGAVIGVAALLSLVPLLLLAYLSVSLAADAVEDEASARVSSSVVGRADALATEMLGLSRLVESYARRPHLLEAVRSDDRAGILLHLRGLHDAQEGIAVTFLADASGSLVDIVPRTPSIVGSDFSFRDWYRGVMTTGRPYVSEAYVTAAAGNETVVAAAVPVRDVPARPDRVLGVLVAAYSLDHIQAFVERFAASQGISVTVTDQRGVVLARPSGAPTGLVSLRDDPRVAAALRGDRATATAEGRLGGQVSAYAPVPELGWAVVASVPEETVFAGVRKLRATVLSIAALLTGVLLVGLALLGRTLWLRDKAERVAEAARRDLAARNEELEAAQTELEHQNTELELQAAELEDQRARLGAANDELEAQQAELERAVADLADEKERVEALYRFSELLAAQSDVDALSESVLRELADFAGAELGMLYTATDGPDRPYELAATRGLARSRAAALLEPGDGLAGRALVERRRILASHPDTELRLRAPGGDAAVRHELHLPLLQGDRCIAVLSLARVGGAAFSPLVLEPLEHLAQQAAVALANALSFQAARRLAEINRAVLEAAVDGKALIDLEGRFVLTNEAALRLADVHGADFAAMTIDDVERAVAERTTDPAAYAEAASAGEDEHVLEYELAASGRSFRRFTAPVRDDRGSLVGRVWTIREITAEREGERLKTDLLATVSHELRTPLASIVGFSELLSVRDVDAGTAKEYVRTIHRESLRLTELVNTFLDLQRIEEGRLDFERRPFELDDLLREQVAMFAGQSDVHRVELSLGATPLVALGDRDRVAQVVANLLSNAIKYSPGGGRVALAAERRNGSIYCAVTDEGLGVPPEHRSGLFAKFYRVDSADRRDIGGTGLGLALCREIVEAHGGSIGFDSELGRGSTFWFSLVPAE